MKLQFKFREQTGEAGRKKVLSALGNHGAISARRLFPSESDNELAYIYVVDVPDETTGRRVLTLLNGSKDVEFAEWEVRRKLVRHGRPT